MKYKSLTMQKTWSMLSDSDSPNSASSIDANYSSPSGGNSSDDSNCSNQTNYSMSTSIITSPPASSGSSSSSPSSSSSNSSGDSPPPPTLSPPAKELKENPPFNYVTTPQLAETTLQRIKQRYCTPPDNNGNNSESAMRSLELLRMTVQSSFDKDIDMIMRRYIETYFKPAFSNIKENLGDTAVSEEVLQKMSCALLENSKSQYHGLRIRTTQQGLYFTPQTIGTDSNGEQQPQPQPQPQPPQLQTRIGTKRQMTTNNSTTSTTSTSSTTSTASTATTALITSTTSTASAADTGTKSPPQKRAFGSVANKSQSAPSTTTAVGIGRRTLISAPLPPSNFQPFRGTAIPNEPGNNNASRRQIIWNTANVSVSTRFVLDVQANQAFDFGTDGRERLASKHPELIRYLPDSEDRDWLVSQLIISPYNRNSRFLFLIYEEVCNLLHNQNLYRSNPNINLGLMRSFVLPEFIIEKMRAFFIDLNIKSRGLITTSNPLVQKTKSNNSSTTISATVTNSSNQSNQFVSNPIPNLILNSNPNLNVTITNTPKSNSQLRTALLQGQIAQQPQLNLFNEDTLMSSNTSNDNVTTTTIINDSSNSGSSTGNTTGFSTAFQPSFKTSTLSSSHATLTALLNSTSLVPPLTRVYVTTGPPTRANANMNANSQATATSVTQRSNLPSTTTINPGKLLSNQITITNLGKNINPSSLINVHGKHFVTQSNSGSKSVKATPGAAANSNYQIRTNVVHTTTSNASRNLTHLTTNNPTRSNQIISNIAAGRNPTLTMIAHSSATGKNNTLSSHPSSSSSSISISPASSSAPTRNNINLSHNSRNATKTSRPSIRK